ncbi:hypothetical protein [Ensifer sp. OV372]|uniref:hypothetical protein n=1 Tax=Ensifer sp. OV372 TaxID=1855293 RepID=UPI0008EB09F4|nr:hypothetical protein [Ensifer sp. OV372]SFG56783.1 hypothetical protein SAMN05216459_1076 [Ensifer sp. OV372]
MSAEGQTIPDDIREVAISAVQAAREDFLLAKVSDNQANLRKVAIECVEKAILAERERCAQIADHFSQSSLFADWPDAARGAGYYACGDIASAIRNPSPPQQPASLTSDDDLPF